MQHTRLRIAWLVIVPIIVLVGAWGALASPEQTGRLVGGFQRHALTVSNQQVIASQPSLAVGSLTGDLNNPVPFVAFAQQSFGSNVQDVFVRFFDRVSNQWITVAQNRNAGSLNRNRSVKADQPSLEFGGPLVNGFPTVPWVAWQEPALELAGKTNIFAAFLSSDAQGQFWQITGDTGVPGGVPGLNISRSENAANPAIATGSVTAGGTALRPWVAWDEYSPMRDSRQVFVTRVEQASGQNILGGFRWQKVGALTIGQETGLNVDPVRNAQNPDIVFSGPSNTIPWVTWFEDERQTNQGRAARVFAARAVVDASAQGGFRWDKAPACTNEMACALNANPDQDARDPKIASGTLVGQSQPAPWVVFEQDENNGGFTQILVKQWTGSAWRPIGGPLNVNRFAKASDPDIYFIGNVPHVAWVEDLGGFWILYVKHLADTRPGFERWDLDSDRLRGLNVANFNPALAPSLHGTQSTPFVTWQERNRFGVQSDVFEARRVPEGQAWGSNRPPFIRVISGTFRLAAGKQLPLSDTANSPDATDQASERIGSVDIQTSCDHVNGWDNINEIEFMLANDTETIFHAKFNGDTGQISVEDPAYPGTFIGPITPGEGGDIETPFVTLHADQLRVTSHGAASPAVDIDWPLSFKRPTQFKEYTQLLNIKFNRLDESKGDQTSTETGFFEVGRVKVTQFEVMLPGIMKGNPTGQ